MRRLIAVMFATLAFAAPAAAYVDNGWGGYPECGSGQYLNTFVLYDWNGTGHNALYQCDRWWNPYQGDHQYDWQFVDFV